MINGGSDRVHDDDYGDDYEHAHEGNPGDSKPLGELQHAGDEVALIVRRVGRINARPLLGHGVDCGDIIQVAYTDLELRVERIPNNLLCELRVVGVGEELGQRLVFGHELHADHTRVARELVAKRVDSRQRRVVGDVDRHLAHLGSEPVEDLRERMAYQQVDAGEDEDQRDRDHRGQADREVPPETLPGAI